MGDSIFDKTLIAMAGVFTLATLAAYWFPGSNDAAFEIIKIGAASSIGYFLGKKADSAA